MDEIRASIGLEQLSKLENFINLRKYNYHYLKKRLLNIEDVKILNSECNKFSSSSYYSLCIILENKLKKKRFEIINKLNRNGIGTSIHYPKIVSDYFIYKKKYKLSKKNFHNSAKISYQSFNLPIGPHVKRRELDYIVYTLKKVVIEI